MLLLRPAETVTGGLRECKFGGRFETAMREFFMGNAARLRFRQKVLEDSLHRNCGRIPGVLFSARTVSVLLGALVLLCVPSRNEAKDSCPWINEATASGVLDGAVTATVTHPEMSKDPDEATCVFLHQSGATGIELRIEVETLHAVPGAYAAYAEKCGTDGTPLRAIGNEAVTCSYTDKKRKKWMSEQVVGRVREHAFTVRVSSSAASPDRNVLREKARKMAEQLAGFLF
jgi:hypothetical protein